MNKNYRNMLIVGIVSLSVAQGLLGLDISTKPCSDRKKISLRKAAGSYILTHFALFSTIPAVSASYIKLHTGAPLKNSMTDFKALNRSLGKKMFKITPFTTLGAIIYLHYKK
jgi:hypothetical protein